MLCTMQLWATRTNNRRKHLLRAFVNDSVPFVQAFGCLQCHQHALQVPYALMRRTKTNSNVKLYHSRCVLCEGRDGSELLHWPVSVLYMQV